MVRRKSTVTEQIENRDRSEVEETEQVVGPKIEKITRDILIPSGSTLINLACSGNPYGAFAKGTINTIPGASQGGKSFFMMTMMACCAVEERFDDYDLIYDDAEETLAYNMHELFPPLAGNDSHSTYAGRLQPPRVDKKTGEANCSETIDEFKMNILNRLDAGKPFIYVLDSLDSLSSTAEMERELKQAIKSQDKTVIEEARKGYKTEKARMLHEILRMVNGQIKKTGSALFIVQQTKQNMNMATPFSKQWTTTGGNAPFFYSFHQIYISEKQAITDTAYNIKNKVGGIKQIEVTKNKLNGKLRKDGILIPLREDYGVDSVASCITFLKKTGVWKSSSAGIDALEFGVKMSQDNLASYIEENDLQEKLDLIVADVWGKIEDKIKTTRKRRF